MGYQVKVPTNDVTDQIPLNYIKHECVINIMEK